MITNDVRASDARTNANIEPLSFEVTTPDDFVALREAWQHMDRIPKIMAPEDGEILVNDTQVIRSLLMGDESAGALQVSYVTLEPGPGTVDHHQPREDELWFAVDGTWEWTVGNETRVVTKGAFAYIPRNTTHRFANPGDTTAVMFTINTPAGHERGFRKAGEDPERPLEETLRILQAHDFVFHFEL